MSSSRLDQLVKGAPAPATQGLAGVPWNAEQEDAKFLGGPLKPLDPLASLPSSPPQIYLNLLILEASLRSQYLTLRARRRHYTFFLLVLTVWNVYFFYILFLSRREDGKMGWSRYWPVETTERICFMGGIVTGILLWGTGQWERGIRWPRRWIGITNRGLRGINAKLVIIKGPWWKELLGLFGFLFPYSPFFSAGGSSYHYVDDIAESKRDGHGPVLRGMHDDDFDTQEEDLAPGGDYVKLLLLPKPFSPDFRENWDLYRTEYWEKENERRAQLMQKIRQRDREIAKEKGGWLWWTGWRGWRRTRAGSPKHGDIEKPHHHHPPHRHHRRRHSDKDTKFRSSSTRSGSHSRNSSRSTTPTFDLEERGPIERVRRGSANASTPSERRKKKSGANTSSSRMQKLSLATSRRPSSAAGEVPSMLKRESMYSVSSGTESDRPVTPVGEDVEPVRKSGLRKKGGSGSRSTRKSTTGA